MSGVELLPVPVVLFGVELEFGVVVELLEEPLVPLISELLEELDGEVLDGDVVEVELDGDVEFISELLELVVEDGEVELVEPVWLEELEGVLWELCAPLPAPLPSLLVELLELCAIAIPVEKMTADAIVRSFLPMRDVLLSAD